MTIEEVQAEVKELSVNIDLVPREEVVNRFQRLAGFVENLSVKSEVAAQLESIVTDIKDNN